MVYFNIDIRFKTIDRNEDISKSIHFPEVNIYDTSFRGAVSQIRYVVSASALSQIISAYVWYIGRNEVGKSEILSYNCYDGKNFIAMIKNTLREDLI